LPALSAYFDESVQSGGDEPICVGGFMFKAKDYRRFCERWRREVLRLPDRRVLRHFHMTDLVAGHGVYEGLSIPMRVEVLGRAVTVISDLFYFGIAVSFNQVEFEQVAPQEWPLYRGSIYTQCCHMCVQSTAYWLKDMGCHLEVQYVFERGHRLQSEANNALRAIASNPEARKDFRYKHHMFEDKDTEPGLQAADLHAWFVAKTNSMVAAKHLPKSVIPFGNELMRLAKNVGERAKVYPFTGDRLRRFMVEQEDSPGKQYIEVDFGPHKPRFR
jgi:hypothetical protein